MLTNNIEKLENGQGQYTFLLNERGGIIDDLIAYRIGDSEFLLVVNAARVAQDLDWLNRHKPDTVMLTNRSPDFGAVAIQGPKVIELFRGLLGNDAELPARNQIADFTNRPHAGLDRADGLHRRRRSGSLLSRSRGCEILEPRFGLR